MTEWLWGIGGMILTGEIVLPGKKLYIASVVKYWVIIDPWWNDTDKETEISFLLHGA